MRTSNETNELWPAYAKFQANLTAVVKSADNPYFKSKYADINAILKQFKPQWEEQGLLVIQSVDSDANTEKTLGCTTRVLHASSGQYFESYAVCVYEKLDPQKSGAALTYLRRYGLVVTLGLEQVDDDANSTRAKPRVNVPSANVPTGSNGLPQ